MQILYSSAELRRAIIRVLARPQSHDRRVVLVAFVGGHAEAFLPDPKGLEIVCWLQPGATYALTLARLRKRGAKIFKSVRLHMKVYWSSRRGCVICSANASSFALGRHGNKEAGVWFPPNVVDIERLLAYARPKPIRANDLKDLARKEAGPRGPKPPLEPQPPPPDFLEWLDLPARPDWKLGWWSETGDFPKIAVEAAKKSYGVKEPAMSLDVRQRQADESDWLLQSKLPLGTSLEWQYVDFIIKGRPSDEEFDPDYPFHAVQANPSSRYSEPPFKLNGAFRSAFKKAIKSYGAERIESTESLRPPKRLLKLIARNMRPDLAARSSA
jgi:hypothetical protein